MKSTDAPQRLALPLCHAGEKLEIPDTQTGLTGEGRASRDVVWPPETMIPLALGGVPPNGESENGLWHLISSLSQFFDSGTVLPWDSAYSSAIGGYPKGAIALKSGGGALWISTAEDNTSNPDAGGAGWIGISSDGQDFIQNTPVTVSSYSYADVFVLDEISKTGTYTVTVFADVESVDPDGFAEVALFVNGVEMKSRVAGVRTGGADSAWRTSVAFKYKGTSPGTLNIAIKAKCNEDFSGHPAVCSIGAVEVEVA